MESHSFVPHLLHPLVLLLEELVAITARNLQLCVRTNSSLSVHKNSHEHFQLLLRLPLLDNIQRKFLLLFSETTVNFSSNHTNGTPPQQLQRMAFSSSLYLCMAHQVDILFSIKLVLTSIMPTLLIIFSVSYCILFCPPSVQMAEYAVVESTSHIMGNS